MSRTWQLPGNLTADLNLFAQSDFMLIENGRNAACNGFRDSTSISRPHGNKGTA
jgi:hypothetical protein